MVRGEISEMRFERPGTGYLYKGKLQVGSSLDEALELLGEPSKTVVGQPIGWQDGVLYKDIDGRKGHCYYKHATKNVRLFFANYKVAALYVTRSEPSSPGQQTYQLQETADEELPHPFEDDLDILGYWQSVDFVKVVNDFEPGQRMWQGNLHLKNIRFIKGGRTSLGWTWSKNWIWDDNDNIKAQYKISEMGGELYLFFPWLSGDVTIRGQKPCYYVLKKVRARERTGPDTQGEVEKRAIEAAISTAQDHCQNGMTSEAVSANSDPAPVADGLTELQRERLPIRGQELRLLKELADAATAWVSKGDQSSKVEVDRIIELLLTQPSPSVDVYFASAKIANLCGRPDRAISILEDVVAKHCSEDAPGFAEPINLVAYHWIGSIARHSGNTGKAISAYETILQNSKNLEGINQIGHIVSCKLYLAEIALENLKDKNLAVKRLDEITQIIESIDKDKKTDEWDMFLDWVNYQRSVIKDGKIRARQQLAGGDPKKLGMAFMTAVTQLGITGVVAEGSMGLHTTNRQDREILSAASIRRVAEGGRSRIDTSLARLAAGAAYEMEKSTEAEKYYSALFNEDSYFSPMGGDWSGSL